MSQKNGKSEKEKEFNKLKYGWSKYGGGHYGLVTNDTGNTWFCQACGEEQPKEIDPYKIEFAPRQFVRVCPKCFRQKLVTKVTYQQLVVIIRKDRR